MTAYSHSILVGGKTALAWRPEYGEQRGNSLKFSIGAEPGECFFYMLRRDVDAIEAADQVSVVLNTKAGGSSAVSSLTFPQLQFHSATRVYGGGDSDAETAAYLVKLVDRRAIAARAGFSGRTYNIRFPIAGDRTSPTGQDWLSESLNSGVRWSLAEIITQLWGDVGILGSINDLAAAGVTTLYPENVVYRGESSWSALNHLLGRFGFAIKYNPLTAAFSVVKLVFGSDPSLASLQAADLLFHGRSKSGGAVAGPETIRVCFPVQLEDAGTEQDTWSVDHRFIDQSANYIDIATGIAGAEAGTKIPLWTTTPAVVASGEPAPVAGDLTGVVNSSDLTDEATALADAWVRVNAAESNSRDQAVVSGWVSTWVPGQQIVSVIWRDVGAGPVTEVFKSPGIPGVAEESIFPRDRGAAGVLPLEPRLVNLVQVRHVVESGDPADGDTVSANASNLHPGIVRRWVEGAMAELEACWIGFVDDWEAVAGDVDAIQNEIYGPGRLCGLFDVSGDRRPLYLVRKGDLPSEGVPVENVSGYDIPPYGVMRVGSLKSGSDSIIEVHRPGTTWYPLYLINGPNEIPDGEQGTGYWHIGKAGKVLKDSGTTAAVHQSWGPKPDQFKLYPNRAGFQVVRKLADADYIDALQVMPVKILGKTTSTLAKGNSGTINIWVGAGGSEAVETGLTITAYNKFRDMSSGKWVMASRVNGVWYLDAGECD